MKIYRIAQHTYHYHTNCISARGNDISDMVDSSREIGYNTFIKNVDIEEIKEAFPQYDWDRRGGLKLKDDWAVRYYKGIYRGQPCVYIDHSAIEYVFI